MRLFFCLSRYVPVRSVLRIFAAAFFAIAIVPSSSAHAAGNVPVHAGRGARRATSGDTRTGVVIDVNGTKMTRMELDKRVMREVRHQAMQMGMDETMAMSPEMSRFRADFDSKVAESIISHLVLLDAARKAHVTVSQDSLTSAWNDVLRSFPSDDVMNAVFKREGETRESIMKEVREGLLINRYLESKIGHLQATESEAYNFYIENRERFMRPETVHARHILVRNDTTGLASITEIKRQLDAGADFSDLAKAKSIDNSAASGGDLGTFARGRMVPAFESVAFSLPVGKVSDPVRTQFGYHLILVDEHQQEQRVDFDQAKESCMRLVQNKKTNAAVLALIESLRKRSRIINKVGK